MTDEAIRNECRVRELRVLRDISWLQFEEIRLEGTQLLGEVVARGGLARCVGRERHRGQKRTRSRD